MRILIFLLFILGAIATSSQWIKIENHQLKETVTFYIALKQNEMGVRQLENYILNHASNIKSDYYGHYLSIDAINNLVTPSNRDIYLVLRWLKRNHIYDCDHYGDSIKCSGNMKDVENLFKVKLNLYLNVRHMTKIYKSDQNYVIPKHLEHIIEFVDGISNPLVEKPNKKLNYRASSQADPGAFTREVMQRLYNLTDTYAYTNSSVGAMEFMGPDGFSNNDLATSQRANGVTVNKIKHILGYNNPYPDTESELDVQVMYWAATNSTLWYDHDNVWIYAWSTNIFNRKHIPEVLSLSWGWDETQQCSIVNCSGNINNTMTYVQRCNRELLKITARGSTILVASGDAGSPDRTNEMCNSNQGPYGWTNMNPIFPGNSPYVLSVGATYIVNSNQTYNYTTPYCRRYPCCNGTQENGVEYDIVGWTTGGGFNHWNGRPAWQNQQVSGYLNSGITLPNSIYFNASNRAFPDVSAVGHNCAIYQFGWEFVDGTSCSTPVFAGIITHLNSFQKQKSKPILGFVNPLLYQMYEDDPATFNDITVGTTACTEYECCGQDFGFLATQGWDPVGGLGTPNIGRIKEYLQNNIKLHNKKLKI
jgi:tripeptidyl-peptidase I